MKTYLFSAFKVLIIALLPFLVLIRGSIFFHFVKGFNAYLSLFVAGLMTAFLLVIYFSSIQSLATKKSEKQVYLKRRFLASFLLVFSFMIYGIVSISLNNTKTSHIKKEFISLNPILRLGCSTLFFLDERAIITDAARKPEDYKKMGLKTNKHSLHYKQEDGFAYAIDIRTNNRSYLRNQLLPLYFNLMGFKTIRHNGTGDHLHISMPCRFRKNSFY